MSLLPNKTLLESDLAADESAVLEIAEALHNLAAKMSNAHARFWSRPVDRILASANHDIAATIARFEGNFKLGSTVNEALDLLALDRFPVRVPLEKWRGDIVFDGAAFVFVPPEPTEPTELPDPQTTE